VKQRHVYSSRDVAGAQRAVARAREAGVADADISLIARSDIELERIADERKLTETDFTHAAIRGAGYGGAAGLLAGVAAVVVAPLGLTLAGVAAIGLAGAVVGSWASALVGASVPDPVRQKFDDEIQAGRVLIVIDAEEPTLARADAAMTELGIERLDYDRPTAIG